MKFSYILTLMLLMTAAHLAYGHTDSNGQLFVRRNVTRPCRICEIPSGYDYSKTSQSRGTSAMSERFVFSDDLDRLRQRETNDVAIDRKQRLLDIVSASRFAPKLPERRSQGVASAGSVATQGQSIVERQARSVLSNGAPEEMLVDSHATPIDATQRIERDHKVFQWVTRSIAIDHCEITDVSVGVSRSGDWNVSFKANQNRFLATNPFHPSKSFKRNKFVIKLHFYGTLDSTFGLATNARISRTGKPIVASLEAMEVMIDQGQPRAVFKTGIDKGLAKNFDQIDRVEIEFSYEK